MSRYARTKRHSAAVIMISIALVCSLLCSCSGLEGCVEHMPVLSEKYAPRMTLEGEAPYQTPAITGSFDAENNTVELSAIFQPIADMLRQTNADGEVLRLEYSFEKDEQNGGYNLGSRLVSLETGTQFDLPDINVPYTGSITVSEPFPDLDFLSDGDFAQAYIYFTSNGRYTVDTTRAGQIMTDYEVCAELLNYYRTVTGKSPDLSLYTDLDGKDLDHLQALELDLCYEEPFDYYNKAPMNSFMFLNAAAGFINAMYDDICGAGSATFDTDELLWAVETLFSTLDLNSDYHGYINNTMRYAHSTVYSGNIAGLDDPSALRRSDLACIFMDIYEYMHGEVSEDEYDYWEGYTEDAYMPAHYKALHCSVMEEFPSGGLFGGVYAPGAGTLGSLAHNFVSACAAQFEMDTYGESGEYPVYEVNYNQVISFISKIDSHAVEYGLCEEEEIIVINDRDYDWYVAQYGTGPYAHVNCMPTISTMAIKWYDGQSDVTPHTLRERYLPDYPDGWYMWQVVECLDAYGVPNSMAELTEDMLAYLDEGHIILTQMSEAPTYASGHCFVIYGYRKFGDTVKFYLHDPGVYNGTDRYGKRPGKSMLLDKAYVDWIIDRIAFYYVVVG